ncbi:MAG: NAD(P)/FAD-dependent oxidoreductase [Sulfolobaceae archaeon]
MNLILGGGIAGLLLASSKKDSMVIESQNKVGGIFSYEDIGEFSIPLYPPLTARKCGLFNQFSYKEVELNVISRKENYLLEKLGVSNLPEWLVFNEKMYYIDNLRLVLDSLSKTTRVRLSTTFTYKGGKRIILSNGIVIKADEIYVTVPSYLLNIKKGRSIGFLEAVFLINKSDKTENTVIVDGDKGVTFSHVVLASWVNNSYDIVYVLVPFSMKIPSWDRVYGDLKRKNILKKEDIISFRYRVIKDAILEREHDDKLKEETEEGIHFCGRLGKWRNFTICETINDILHC